MKRCRKKLQAGCQLLIITILAFGCQKQLDINQSPNNPPASLGTPAIELPAAVMATTAVVGGDYAIIGGIWSNYFTESVVASQYRNYCQYNIQPTDFNSDYSILMTTGLKNYQDVINKAAAAQDWKFYLIATVMKAYTAEVLVDLYDQIPYDEALQGQGNLNPKVEDGHDIYLSLISSIDSALSKDLTVSTNTDPTAVDLVFAGNMNEWIAFANTLKLKMYLRLVNKYPSDAQSGINSLYSSGASFLTTDAAVTGFADQDSKRNPMYEMNKKQLNTPDNLRASTTFVSWLKANNDSRIVSFFGSANITSVNQGDDNAQSPGASTAPDFVQHYNDPVEFISAAESYFLQAEANLRYNVGTVSAQSLYESGVTAAFGALGLDASSYISSSGVYAYPASGSASAQLNAIITQKWASCAYGCHGIEAFFEKNRTGFPQTSPVYSTSISYVPGQIVVSNTSVLPAGELPQRFPVPYVETQSNTNAPALVPITVPVWWAIGAN